MASDETMTFQSSLQDEDFEDDINLFQNPHPHNLSRLSVCTSMEDDVDNLASMCMSRLSIESFQHDGGEDADGEFSDGKEMLLSSSSENESGSCYSLPATPPRRRNRGQTPTIGVKECASENELVKKEVKKNRRRRRRRIRDMWVVEKENSGGEKSDQSTGTAGGGGGGGVMVIARPKGGKRNLCMDLEEVKACKDLGFELEHERMFDVPSRLSFSSSGSNSPIANWRISSPGDDPRDVKARLKVWAQAVALASTSSKFSY